MHLRRGLPFSLATYPLTSTHDGVYSVTMYNSPLPTTKTRTATIHHGHHNGANGVTVGQLANRDCSGCVALKQHFFYPLLVFDVTVLHLGLCTCTFDDVIERAADVVQGRLRVEMQQLDCAFMLWRDINIYKITCGTLSLRHYLIRCMSCRKQ